MRVRIPKQERSRERRLRIMEAGLALFAQKGMNGTSSNEIALRAGVSIGTFYSYFENKKTLFLELLRDHLENFISGIYTLEPDYTVPMREIISSHILKAFTVFNLHPSFHKEALVLKFSDPEVKRLFDEVEQEQLAIISSLLEHYGKNSNRRDLEAVSKVIHSAVENVAHYVKFLEYPMDRDRLIEELTEMIYHYVNSLSSGNGERVA
ncbi:MAG: TetR/AcrR family transcriptional regulator [Syntrophaceae bacterium]|nr:TetR/AcrR family transcriptional regulator [Deltaproteobacteria bacterium]